MIGPRLTALYQALWVKPNWRAHSLTPWPWLWNSCSSLIERMFASSVDGLTHSASPHTRSETAEQLKLPGMDSNHRSAVQSRVSCH